MAWKKKNPRKRQLPGDPSKKKHYTLIVGQKQEEIKMVKVTIEFDGGAEVFTGDAVSCVVITNEPDGTRSCSMLKGAFRRSFPVILADTCFSQVKASQKNHSPLDQLEALAAFAGKAQGLMDQEIEANVGRPEVLKQILEATKEE